MKKITILVLLIASMVLVNLPLFAVMDGECKPLTMEEQIKYHERMILLEEMIEAKKQDNLIKANKLHNVLYGKNLNNIRKYYNSVSITHYGQETGYYCGPAACKSVISVVNSSVPSQSTLASELGTNPSTGTEFGSTFENVLNNYIPSHSYSVLYNWSNDVVDQSIRSDIDAGYGVIANGCSAASGESHISGYPTNVDVWHYVAVYGYGNDYFRICDPASNQPGFNISSKYNLKYSKFMEFTSQRGVIW